MALLVTLAVSIGTYALFDKSSPRWLTFAALMVVGLAVQRSVPWRRFGAGLMAGGVVAPWIIAIVGVLLFLFLPG